MAYAIINLRFTSLLTHLLTLVWPISFKILFETGVIVLFTVSRHSGDVEGILIDKSLLPRLQEMPIDRGIGNN